MAKCACGSVFQGNGAICPKCQRDQRAEEMFRHYDWDCDDTEEGEDK